MVIPCTALAEQAEKVNSDSPKQKTLRKSVSLSGIGLFTGTKSTLTLRPAPPNTGFIFRRMDLPHHPTIKAELKNVLSTIRCTLIGSGDGTVQTVEHILSVLVGMGIDNLLLELSGPEIPIKDGSGAFFVEALLKGEIFEQSQEKDIHFLRNPVSWSNGEIHLVALPADEFSISYTLHYPNSKVIGTQYFQLTLSPSSFCREIASCRTFCLYEEIYPFIEKGWIKGGGLDNALIIQNDEVINPEGLRFENEPVRHKILDLIGDLALIPESFVAHIIAIRSGHASNIAFAKELYHQIKKEKY